MTGEVRIRPLTVADALAGQDLAGSVFDAQSAAAGHDPEEQGRVPYDDPERRAQGVARLEASLASDPAGCWAAEDDDGFAGIAVALRRERLWILSLLVVRPDLQSQGVGARLLERARSTEAGSTGGWIMSTSDPRALRRYHAAGFLLEPGYGAWGTPDRAKLPAELGVRDGDLARDADLVDSVTRAVRGAARGRDTATMLSGPGTALAVLDEPGSRGYAITSRRGPLTVAATTGWGACRLLWHALAVAPEQIILGGLTTRQAWAVDVALAARLTLRSGPSICLRGDVGPYRPYLPDGRWG